MISAGVPGVKVEPAVRQITHIDGQLFSTRFQLEEGLAPYLGTFREVFCECRLEFNQLFYNALHLHNHGRQYLHEIRGEKVFLHVETKEK